MTVLFTKRTISVRFRTFVCDFACWPPQCVGFTCMCPRGCSWCHSDVSQCVGSTCMCPRGFSWCHSNACFLIWCRSTTYRRGVGVILAWYWREFRVMWAWCWCDVGVMLSILKSQYNTPTGVMLAWCWWDVRVMLVCCWRDISVTLGRDITVGVKFAWRAVSVKFAWCECAKHNTPRVRLHPRLYLPTRTNFPRHFHNLFPQLCHVFVPESSLLLVPLTVSAQVHVCVWVPCVYDVCVCVCVCVCVVLHPGITCTGVRSLDCLPLLWGGVALSLILFLFRLFAIIFRTRKNTSCMTWPSLKNV